MPNADRFKIKSGLAFEITRAMHKLGLNRTEAATRMGITQAKVLGMMRGDFANLSERKLMDCLNRLGYEIEILLTPKILERSPLTLAAASSAPRPTELGI